MRYKMDGGRHIQVRWINNKKCNGNVLTNLLAKTDLEGSEY